MPLSACSVASSLSPLVIPTDLSASAASAAAYAAGLARAVGAEVHLLLVLGWPDAGPFETPGDAPSAAAEEAAETERALTALAAAAEAAGLEAPTLAVRRSRTPAAEIGRYADEVGARLLVMGLCGRESLCIGAGSVATTVLQTAPCDVLVVPRRTPSTDAPGPPGRLLVPVDFSSASVPLVGYAAGLARALGVAHLDLVHVLEPLPVPFRWIDETVVDLVPEIRNRAGRALANLAELAGLNAPDADPSHPLEVRQYVERGKPARTLARVVQALGSDLVVLGPHAERPVLEWLLGSVAEGVVRRVTCPVLVARRSAAPDPHAHAHAGTQFADDPLVTDS